MHTLFRKDKNYPPRLNDLFDPPSQLYMRKHEPIKNAHDCHH
jgi:predicted Rossmann fold nucleotide-binding protein DprA/Smf involved in DNA uptake